MLTSFPCIKSLKSKIQNPKVQFRNPISKIQKFKSELQIPNSKINLGSPAGNRTPISGSGNLHIIRYTTGPVTFLFPW